MLSNCKHHFLYMSPGFISWLLEKGTREQIIEWWVWNDGNGCFTDEDATAEFGRPHTLEELRELLRDCVK